METAEIILAAAGSVAAVLFGVWRMTESIRQDVRENRAELREGRRDSAQEHKALEAEVVSRFAALDDRDRRRLRAMLE